MNKHRAPRQTSSCKAFGAGASTALTLPPIVAQLMAPLRDLFTAPVWSHVLVLIAGATLATGKRTVTSLCAPWGWKTPPIFALYHRVLSRARWSSLAVAHKLLAMIVARFGADGAVVIGLDDTIERRWGAKISARGIYRDPVRSTEGQCVKVSGLRWLALMALVPVPWAKRRWALPFLRPRPIRALSCRPRTASQNAHRLGSAGHSPNPALAAGSQDRRSWQFELFVPWAHRRHSQPRHFRDAAEARRRPLRSAAPAGSEPARAARRKGR